MKKRRTKVSLSGISAGEEFFLGPRQKIGWTRSPIPPFNCENGPGILCDSTTEKDRHITALAIGCEVWVEGEVIP